MFDYNHLLALEYREGLQDCYSILRRYYREAWDIHLPNYARPTRFWEDRKLDLYQMYRRHGFEPIFDKHPQIGDTFLTSIMTAINAHALILVEPNKVIHHLPRRLSTVEFYQPRWANRVNVHLRHPLITEKLKETRQTVSLHEVGNAHLFRNPEFQKQLERALGSES